MTVIEASEEIATVGLSGRAVAAMDQTLRGSRRGFLAITPFVGPAVVASIAYLDPGNFAANIQAGAGYGYQLLWVVVIANLAAMLFQAMAAKLGIVTGRNLAELARETFPKPVVIAMWIASEFAAMATDLAEFLGGAVGFMLLFHLPLGVAMAAMAVLTYAILTLKGGFRPMELVIGVFVGVIALAYVAELIIAPPDWSATAAGIALPRLADGNALLLAVGIIGSTVMPHAIYLHSGLTQGRAPARSDRDRARLTKYSNREVVIALGIAGLVNMAMVMMAAHAFHDGVHNNIASIETAYQTLIPALGNAAAGLFLIALTASGISSSVVGTMAGQMIMQGFAGFRIPVWVRRLVTMLPAFVVVLIGCDVTWSLIMSQVVLSLVLPVPMIALILLSRKAEVMGSFKASLPVTLAASFAAAVVLGLNFFLLLNTFGVSVFG